jgi:hypothetical protein
MQIIETDVKECKEQRYNTQQNSDVAVKKLSDIIHTFSYNN